MSYPRQQRGANFRGRVQIPNQRPVPDLFSRIFQITGNDIDIFVEGTGPALLMSGIPQVLNESTGTYPIAAVLTGATITLTYSAPPSETDFFRLRSTDPALRDANGAFLAAFRGQQDVISDVPNTPSNAVMNYQNHFGNTVVLDFSAGDGMSFLGAATQIVNETQGLPVIVMQLTGANLSLEFAAPQNSGDLIRLTSAAVRTDLAGTCKVTSQAIVLP